MSLRSVSVVSSRRCVYVDNRALRDQPKRNAPRQVAVLLAHLVGRQRVPETARKQGACTEAGGDPGRPVTTGGAARPVCDQEANKELR